jgi:DeoR family fructose operon transcriptional repressor
MALPNPTVEDRLTWLRERLESETVVTFSAAAEALGVSEMTIRRDAAELEERGAARRVRGGLQAVGPLTFAQRRDRMARAKSRVAAKLVELVPATGAVSFDASSTVMRVATSLTTARDLVVVTNGPDTFAALQGRPGVTALSTGGQLDARTGSLVGPLACRAAQQVAVARLFTSAAAVDPATGALEATLDEAEVKRAMAGAAAEVVLAVDSSKLTSQAFAVSVEWDRIDMLVTDLDPADTRLDPFRNCAEIV